MDAKEDTPEIETRDWENFWSATILIAGKVYVEYGKTEEMAVNKLTWLLRGQGT